MPTIHRNIEILLLAEPARSAAYQLITRYPAVNFTSGRRTRAQQAHAMAVNTLHRVDWIAATYKPNKVSEACQRWVDLHPSAFNLEALTSGLLRVLNDYTDQDLTHLSRHLSGLAFDVQPLPGQRGIQLQRAIRSLPHLERFLTNEGGLRRWHAQFKALDTTKEP
jgi:hypothetical protein